MSDAPILILSTSDTDLLSARASGANYRWANPSRILVDDLPGLLDGMGTVVVRLLGGRRGWEEGIDAVIASAYRPSSSPESRHPTPS
ncbi:Probable cobalamin biosynthesis protein CobN [Mycobacteroides abscessus]|nr:Probable cobalamin biosynthesis protein CobN [Mycobacteroides abscessus]